MKFKVIPVLLVAIITTVLLLASCNNGAPSTGQVYELTYNNFFAGTHFNSILAQQWIEEIEERSKGSVKIAYYPGGTLAAANKTYDGVVQGICDIGMSVLAYNPGRFPVSELVDLPHGYPNGWVATQVANDYYNEYKPAEFNDVHILYFHAHGPGVIFTAKTPVRTMENMKGLVIRGTGIGVKVIEALGAKGSGASQGETAELLSRGVVDGNYSPPETLQTWKQAEVVKYVTMSTDVGNTSMMFVAMNKAKWDALPANIQKIITDVSKDWPQKHGKAWSYYDGAAIDYFKDLGGGREVITLSKDESARWITASVKPLVDKYISDKTAAGFKAADYEKYLAERVKYWTARTPTQAQFKSFVDSEIVNWKPK
jgi:TRAP-type C4-dicarboxylate transport system substrate-binding protein